MASGGGKRKIGHNKGKPSNVAYKAQDRAAKNKRRRAAREQGIKQAHAEKRGHVARLRAAGAIRRLEARITAVAEQIEEKPSKAQELVLARLNGTLLTARHRLADLAA